MATSGTTTVDFGAFPGKTDTTATVTGQTGILSGSLVEAWIFPTATADHSADEHWVDTPLIMAGNVSAGVGFTIYATTDLPEEVAPDYTTRDKRLPIVSPVVTPMPYGLWTVAWVWS